MKRGRLHVTTPHPYFLQNHHGYDTFVVIIIRSWFVITGVTRRVLLLKQELLTLPVPLMSLPDL